MAADDQTADRGSVPPPFPLAIVIADYIHVDPSTGKKTILGTFSAIHAKTFPAIHPVLSIYLSLTGGHDALPFKVQLVDADEEYDPLWSAEGEMQFEDPRIVAEMIFIMSGITFPKPGEYRIQFFANDQFVIERRLLLLQREQQND